ncbi:D-alanyl-D-alanine carboxypeptidase/D-alanyl-D-alanine endopeptidase [Pararhodospirillum photometricum]|uniref:Peptidase S13, D-Ala-D-Ala carboxypeptidase C n=1 Tax=Pararhodospirillum photometricum DSM 122 TaxID=1150469 RepID=H6SP24_PARPM|nr:D-alanyl-D-alanine carboxypeptidase/D-alanyl-D-alanine-endopeptidase [Pararhodospirillum photometricum]CCG07096.1 Peptidase S13, D-Ala-D-Ala carboxypeptidase C [Pararhodospirillum photometricum DSM 122]
MPRAHAQQGPLDADALIARYGFRPDQVGFAVFDPQANAWIETHMPDQPFLPASVSKVPTTVAALEMLGPTFRWQTRFVSAAPVVDGVLKGDLYLVGDGDPTLDGPTLARLVRGLEGAGIRAVQGNFYYDDTLVATGPVIEATQPDDLAYNPGYGALSLDFNRALLSWDPKAGPRFIEAGGTPVGEGQRVRVARPGDPDAPPPGLRPHFEGVQGVVPASLAGAGEAWVLPSSWKGTGSLWLPVKHPGAYTANAARVMIQRRGIALGSPRPAAAPPQARILAVIESAPLYDVVAKVLKTSNNLVAEMIGLATTRRLTGQVLPLAESAAVVNRLFAGSLAGVDWSSFRLANHSGLSPESRATPRQIATILDYAQRHAFHGLDYAALLPRRPWHNSDDDEGPAPGSVGTTGQVPVWAKTGTVYYGRGLAGFLVAGSGRLLTFAIFVSDFDKREAFDRLNRHDSAADVRAARAWLGRARALERDLADLWRARH